MRGRAAAHRVRDLLSLVAARDDDLEERLFAGESSDEERRILIALFVHCIAQDPAAGSNDQAAVPSAGIRVAP